MFKKDFVEIQNDDTPADLNKKADSLYSKLLGWTSRFPNNKASQSWREQELLKKKSK